MKHGGLAGHQLYHQGNCAHMVSVLVDSSLVKCTPPTLFVVPIWDFSISFNFHVPLHVQILDVPYRGSAKIPWEKQSLWKFWLDQKQEGQETLFLKSHFSHCWCLENQDKLWAYFQIFGCPSKHALNGVWNLACWGGGRWGIGQQARWDRIGSRSFLHLVSRMMEVKLEVSHP